RRVGSREGNEPTAVRGAGVVDDRGERKWEIRSMTEQKPRKPGGPDGHSRRDFLRGSGVAAATAVLTGQATMALDEAQAAQDEPKVLAGTVEITLKVNGQDRSCAVEPRSTLL